MNHSWKNRTARRISALTLVTAGACWAAAASSQSPRTQKRELDAVPPPEQNAPPGEKSKEKAQKTEKAQETKQKMIDPAALAAFDRMGAFLRAQKSFSVRAETMTDYVFENGQKVEFGAKTDMSVRRPDRLHASTTSDLSQRQVFYDGKTFTILGEQLGLYATFAAPPTLAQVAEAAEAKKVDLPLVDLFYWGTDKAGIEQIESAIDVGPAIIDGTATEHFALRQKDVDWQVWVAQGGAPLPRRFVVTTRTDPAKPDYAANLTWDLGANFEESEFKFVPPPGTHKVEVGTVPKEDSKHPKAKDSTHAP